MTAPVPPAHLSFIEGIFFLRPVSSSSLKTMIFASCPPSSITEYTSGWSFSTASETAVTSCTNFAPIMFGQIPPPPEPVMKMRQLSAVDADLGFHALQEFEGLLRLLGLVALVVLPEDLVSRCVDHDRLHRRRADIEADQVLRLMVVRLLIVDWNSSGAIWIS